MSKIIQFRDEDGELFPVTTNPIIKKLPIGALVQGVVPNPKGGLFNPGAADNVVTTRDVIMMPYRNPKFMVKAPDGIEVTFYYNKAGSNEDGALMNYPTESYACAEDYARENGETIDFNRFRGERLFSVVTCRLAFSYKDGTMLYKEDVEDWINSGELAIYYESYSQSIVERNQSIEPTIRSLSTHFKNGMAVSDRKLHALPLFVHGSDFHSDIIRFRNFMDYADYIGADGAFATGDFVFANGNDGIQYVAEEGGGVNEETRQPWKKRKTLLYPCCGNHDRCVYPTEDFDRYVIQPFFSRYKMTLGGVGCYYNDISKWSLRIIVLNQYVNDGSNNISIYMGEDQKKSFLQLLLSTPIGYGIIILDHAPCRMIDRVEGSDEFYNYAVDETDHDFDAPYDIIDAFIARKSISGTWKDASGSYSYSADFSVLPSNVEFIAWVNGHEHRDMIGYVHGTAQKQLCLNVNCANALMETNGSDLGRDGDGKSQDCFNVYAIDRENKRVKVARVGADVNCDMKEVKYMTIPYA